MRYCQKELFSKPIQKSQKRPAQLIAREPTKKLTTKQASETDVKPINDFQEIDVNPLQSLQQRSVGVEHVGLHAISQMGLIEKFKELGESRLSGLISETELGSVRPVVHSSGTLQKARQCFLI